MPREEKEKRKKQRNKEKMAEVTVGEFKLSEDVTTLLFTCQCSAGRLHIASALALTKCQPLPLVTVGKTEL